MIDSLGALGLPLLRRLPPETAHRLTLRALKMGFAPGRPPTDDPILATELWGRHFANPVGLAAGFDKNGEVPEAMLRWGFGFVEAGTVTPLPQKGNPQPRLFRLPEDQAVINRLGFNNGGLEAAAALLSKKRKVAGILGINVGKNRDAADVIADYRRGVTVMGAHADYLVINISSPNTPGLRALQRRSEMAVLVEAVVETLDALRLAAPPPILVKVAPDLDRQELADIAEVALASRLGGLIVSNTTVARPAGLSNPNAAEPGGLSGAPLFAPATAVLATLYRLTGGRVPLIGVGGVASGAHAYEKIRAGASLVQLYTALIYHGPGLVGRIKTELAALLRRDGFASVAAAVGSGNRVEPSSSAPGQKMPENGQPGA